MNKRAIVLLSLICWAGSSPWAAAEPIQPPFDVEAARTANSASAKSFSCKTPPAPVRDLIFDSIYEAGTNSSVVNEKNLKSYQAARKPVDEFEKGIIQMGDAYIASKPAKPEIAVCALDWMGTWAAAGAILGKVSQQGGYGRKWVLGSAAMAYVKIRDAAGLDSAKKRAIEAWLKEWAKVVREDYSTGMDRGSRRNNHANWAGWSLMAAAVALDDRSHFEWAMSRYRAGIAQIEEDGTLPLEMARRTRALHYHLFSIPPLVMIAETARQNGVDLYAENKGSLHRLIARTMEGLVDPAYFAEKAGYKQEWKGKPSANDIAWGQPYSLHYREPNLATFLSGFSRLYSTRIGGDMTLLFPPGARQP